MEYVHRQITFSYFFGDITGLVDSYSYTILSMDLTAMLNGL